MNILIGFRQTSVRMLLKKNMANLAILITLITPKIKQRIQKQIKLNSISQQPFVLVLMSEGMASLAIRIHRAPLIMKSITKFLRGIALSFK
jgi:hypothetical protein